jgi:hypothetical protein
MTPELEAKKKIRFQAKLANLSDNQIEMNDFLDELAPEMWGESDPADTFVNPKDDNE